MAGYYKKYTKKATKANGRTYFAPNKCWYNYDSAENREFAQYICHLLNEFANKMNFGKKMLYCENDHSDYNDANVTSFPKRIVEAIRDNYESLDNGWIL